ncbi:MAG: hypothetical protein OXK17_08305 [Thaumarchaeota archaeon]|nr:hypothetical protein [Nitrososphaerota archaeon]
MPQDSTLNTDGMLRVRLRNDGSYVCASGLRTAVVMLPSAIHAPDAAVAEGARSTAVAPATSASRAGAR